MNIHDVNKSVAGHKKSKRKGRGAASGLGKTAGRGQNGLGSRAGANYLKGFVGGQSPLRQRMRKRGFNNANFRTAYDPINLTVLDRIFDAGAKVGLEELKASGYNLRRNDKVKILGTGDLDKPLHVTAHAFSKSAKEKIEKAGGTVTLLDGGQADAGKAESADKKAD